MNTKARKQMPQAHARPSANDCFGDACGQRRLGGAGPAGVPLVVLHGSGGASGVLRSCRRSAGAVGTIGGASGAPFALPGCRRLLACCSKHCYAASGNCQTCSLRNDSSQKMLNRKKNLVDIWFLDLCSLLV